MSKVIIGIHGLGSKPSRDLLSKWWIQSIKDGLIKIDKNIIIPEFKMIYWADVFNEKPLDENITDKEDPLYLEEKYTPAPVNFKPKEHPNRKKFLEFLEKQMDKIFLNEDLSINYSFISDIIIRRYFKELDNYYSKDPINYEGMSMPVKEIIVNKVVEVLKKYEGYEIYFITHSMGTIIAYDVLSFIIPDFKIDTFVTMGSPLGLPIIMSKIASEQNVIIHHTEKPTTPAGIKRFWYNFSDLEDGVAMNYNLNDDYAPNSEGIQPTDFVVCNDYEINGEKNPHKAYGYLRTPEFSKTLYEFIIREEEKPKSWFYIIIDNIIDWISSFTKRSIEKLSGIFKGNSNES